jgi:hypothetical protein
MIRRAMVSKTPPHPGADCAYPPLQSGLHLLQRVRNGLPTGASRRNAETRGPVGGAQNHHYHISGEEPMLHPGLDEIIRRMRRNGAIATLMTNRYLLSAEYIQQFNRAGSITCKSAATT